MLFLPIKLLLLDVVSVDVAIIILNVIGIGLVLFIYFDFGLTSNEVFMLLVSSIFGSISISNHWMNLVRDQLDFLLDTNRAIDLPIF